MIVPLYWSESKEKRVVDGRQFTVKRFGWSNESERAAKARADERLRDALSELECNGDVCRIDHKTSYNGAEGVPIREELIAQHGDIDISRNAYGDLCLNTPDLFFADIDFQYDVPGKLVAQCFIILVAVALGLGSLLGWSVSFYVLLIPVLFSYILASCCYKIGLVVRGGLEGQARKRIESVAVQYPDLHIRVYRTPRGFRILLMNAVYDPTSDLMAGLMSALRSDRIYMQTCKNQNCFWARVSPKPWRIAVDRLRPRSGVWPIKQELLAARQDWVSSYERASEAFAACRFVVKIGSDNVVGKAERVRKLHDEMCRSDLGLEIA